MDPISGYHALTAAVAELTGSDKLAHVHVGLGIYVGVQALMRDRRVATSALAAVLLLEVGNEFLDRLFYGDWRWRDTLADLVATMFWPMTLWSLARYRRSRRREMRPFRRANGAAAAVHVTSRLPIMARDRPRSIGAGPLRVDLGDEELLARPVRRHPIPGRVARTLPA